MKVVLIHGQSHKGTSYNIGKSLLSKLERVDGVDEYFLPRDMDEFCLGCYKCLLEDETACPHYDKIKPITRSIDQSDLMIFTTPVYGLRTSGFMKAFLDHYFTRWMVHRPLEHMFYKRAVVVAVGAGGGMKKAAKDILVNLYNWGISHIQTITKTSNAIKWEDVKEKKKTKIEKSVTKLARKINSHKLKPSVRLGKKFHFLCMRFLQKKLGSS